MIALLAIRMGCDLTIAIALRVATLNRRHFDSNLVGSWNFGYAKRSLLTVMKFSVIKKVHVKDLHFVATD